MPDKSEITNDAGMTKQLAMMVRFITIEVIMINNMVLN